MLPYLQHNPEIAKLMEKQYQGYNALENVKSQEEVLNTIKDIPKLKKEVERSKILSKKLQETKEIEGLDKAEVKQRKQELEEAMKKKAATYNKAKGGVVTTVGSKLVYEILKHLLK